MLKIRGSVVDFVESGMEIETPREEITITVHGRCGSGKTRIGALINKHIPKLKRKFMKYEYAANIALFLIENELSIYGTWSGKMTAQQQRELFGVFIGKGTIIINGETETICNRVKVCFGHDYDDRNVTKFSAL